TLENSPIFEGLRSARRRNSSQGFRAPAPSKSALLHRRQAKGQSRGSAGSRCHSRQALLRPAVGSRYAVDGRVERTAEAQPSPLRPRVRGHGCSPLQAGEAVLDVLPPIEQRSAESERPTNSKNLRGGDAAPTSKRLQ